MSTLRMVAATERLDRVEFSRRSEYVDFVTDLGTYRCPHCGNAVQFRTRHFEKHGHSRFSNLDAEWRKWFDELRPVNDPEWESFLDFHCRGCRAPVRIIYRAGPEFAMGSHGWLLLAVVDVAAWANDESDA